MSERIIRESSFIVKKSLKLLLDIVTLKVLKMLFQKFTVCCSAHTSLVAQEVLLAYTCGSDQMELVGQDDR